MNRIPKFDNFGAYLLDNLSFLTLLFLTMEWTWALRNVFPLTVEYPFLFNQLAIFGNDQCFVRRRLMVS